MILDWLKDWVKGLFDASQSPLEGVDPPQPPLIRGENEVLVKTLKMIFWGKSRQKIYEYWKANLEDLKDENLLITLEKYAQAKLSLFQEKLSLLNKIKAYWFANNLYYFNIYIQEFPLGSIATNKELSIKSCELALTVFIFTLQDDPEDWFWAVIQISLGLAYWQRIRGERADNLEIAIACFQEALKVYTFTAFPEDWAMTQNNLGNAYSDRIRGEGAENLETAIACYQEALKVYTFTAFSQDWAMTQNNLGSAYLYRIRGERADNLENAIACYQEALNVYTLTAFPQGWADTQICLGTAYSQSIRGERAEDLETAIACYQEALKVYTFTAFPQDWAMTQMNLGSAYSDRIRGERAENLETAIGCYQEALKFYTFTAFPQNWAITQGNLAVAFKERASLNNNAQDLDQAIELYRQALTVSAAGSFYFINHQYYLGTVLARRYETSKNPDDLQQSLAAYQIALNYLSPEHYDRQQYWQAIPATQAILGSRLVRDGNWQEGLKLLINSLNQLKTGDNSLVYANALYQTGYAYELLSDQENARLYYRDALRLYEHLQDLPGIAKSRESLGNVFVSQGHLEKGMSELAQASKIYQQLGKTEAAEKVDNTYQSVQQVLEQVKKEVLV
jgi:tetratricopeptide (TPR) repeat protein